jgi:hypothetical protein
VADRPARDRSVCGHPKRRPGCRWSRSVRRVVYKSACGDRRTLATPEAMPPRDVASADAATEPERDCVTVEVSGFSDELVAELNELALYLVGELDPEAAAEVSEKVDGLLSTEWVPVTPTDAPAAYVADVNAEFERINRRARARSAAPPSRLSSRLPRERVITPTRGASRARAPRSRSTIRRRARSPGSSSSEGDSDLTAGASA